MTVWVVVYHLNIDDSWPDAVFSTKELAESYVARQSDSSSYSMSEHVVDEDAR